MEGNNIIFISWRKVGAKILKALSNLSMSILVMDISWHTPPGKMWSFLVFIIKFTYNEFQSLAFID